jgi:hypothetical protein
MSKTIPKKVRMAVYEKYDGHCAYCGKKIDYKEFQLDHIIPRRNWGNRYTEEQIECFENYTPACRRCNHYKRAHTLKAFRKMIEEIPKKLFRDNYIYKVGLDYGLIEPHERKIKFYFEQIEERPDVDEEEQDDYEDFL